MKKLSLAALPLLALPALCSADLAYRAGVDLSQQQFEREQRNMNLSRGGKILDAQDSTLQADLLPGLYAEAAWRARSSLEVFAAYRYAHTGDASATIDRAAFDDGTVATGIALDVPALTLDTLTLGGRWRHPLAEGWQASIEATASSQHLACDTSLCGERGAYAESAHRFETLGAGLGIACQLTGQVSTQLTARWERGDEYVITGIGAGLYYGF